MESTERKSTTKELVPVDIRTCWEEVKPGIVEILKDRTLSYRPEDVYAACVSEQAFLYKAAFGFVILTVEVDEFTKERMRRLPRLEDEYTTGKFIKTMLIRLRMHAKQNRVFFKISSRSGACCLHG